MHVYGCNRSILWCPLKNKIYLCVFQAYGMSAWPVDLMKGSKGVKRERMTRTYERDDLQGQIQAIKDKVSGQLLLQSQGNIAYNTLRLGIS